VYRYGDRWEAVIRIDGQRHRVGICDTPEEAAVIYDEHAKARNRPLNFPPPARPDPVEPYMQKLIRGETFTTEEFNAFAQASILSDWVAAGNPPETCPKYAPPPAIALGGPRPLRYAPEPQPPPEYHEDEDPQPPLDEDPSYEPPPLLPVAPEIAATLPNISVVNMFGLADEQG
jgi:hypothetical protein